MGEQVAAGLQKKSKAFLLNSAKALWGCSSVGRAPALQAGGHEFESHHLHSEAVASVTYLENCILK